jgi:hypothetical protein
VREHERRNAGGGYAEFVVRDLRRPQRRRNHPRRPAALGGDLDGDAEHRGLPAPAAPSTITSGSVEATAAAATVCPASRPAVRAASVTSGFRFPARGCGGELVA